MFLQCEELGSKKEWGSKFVLVQNASLPRGHASIRIQQYVGIITCMGLVLLRANEMDREDVHVEKKEAHGNPRVHVILYGVFHTWCV